MARFGTRERVRPAVRNRAGGRAFEESPQLAFVSLLLTSFVKNQFYRSANDTLSEVVSQLDSIDPMFAAKTSIYARDKFHMRSITHVVAAELAHSTKETEWMRPFIRKVVQRPDDMLEIMAYYMSKYSRRPLPNAMKRGFRDVLGRKFDAFQLAKWRGEGKSVNLIDIANLVHPSSMDEDIQNALNRLMKDELRSEGTWETMLTEAGQTAETEEEKEELKEQAWKELISTGKIGYMALLKNLRNIMQQSPEAVGGACELLVNPRRIRGSKVLPFRFVTASREIQKLSDPNVHTVLDAINVATEVSLENVPELPGKTLVWVDNSGSMQGNEGNRPIETAALFAAMLVKRTSADLIVFSNHAEYLNLSPLDTLLGLQNQIKNGCVPSGTNFHAPFSVMNRPYDRIIILSDMQGWMRGGEPSRPFQTYRKKYDCSPKVFSIDLSGYGTLQFPEQDIYCLSGFSEKVFDIIELLETDRDAMIKEIESINLV